MNRTHPPTYPRRQKDGGWLDALGRFVALAIFAVIATIALVAVI